MQQSQNKGYSVLENIPEEKISEEQISNTEKIIPKSEKHAALWYWFIFAIIATLVFGWAIALSELQYSWSLQNQNHCSDEVIDSSDDNYDQYFLSLNQQSVSSLSDVLQNLHKNDKIQGGAWDAWTTVKGTTLQQHICKIDDGVGNSGSDYVIKKFDIVHNWDEAQPPLIITQRYTYPKGVQFTGAIVIDHWVDGTGAYCKIDKGQSDITVTMQAQFYRGLHYTILIIGRNSTVAEDQILPVAKTLMKKNDTDSDEFFDQYIY